MGRAGGSLFEASRRMCGRVCPRPPRSHLPDSNPAFTSLPTPLASQRNTAHLVSGEHSIHQLLGVPSGQQRLQAGRCRPGAQVARWPVSQKQEQHQWRGGSVLWAGVPDAAGGQMAGWQAAAVRAVPLLAAAATTPRHALHSRCMLHSLCPACTPHAPAPPLQTRQTSCEHHRAGQRQP